jgi:hypothetical protein
VFRKSFSFSESSEIAVDENRLDHISAGLSTARSLGPPTVGWKEQAGVSLSWIQHFLGVIF